MRLSIDSSVEFSVWSENTGYLFKGSTEFEDTIREIEDRLGLPIFMYTLCEDLDEIRARAQT